MTSEPQPQPATPTRTDGYAPERAYAVLAIDAMNRLGCSEEVHAGLTWLLDAAAQAAPDLRVFYGLDGSVVGAEMHAAPVPGYRGSEPVNVGNSAAEQMQLGCFGDLLDAILRYVHAGGALNEQIRSWIEANCWSETKRAYTFYAGSDELDAAVLLAARTGYCDGGDPRLHTTIDAIQTELGAGDALLYRYSGQGDQEGAFVACSCWMVEALAHAGRREEATRWLHDIVGHANDVGLYTEEIDPATGDLLGNIPQALSHLAIIGAATAIERAAG